MHFSHSDFAVECLFIQAGIVLNVHICLVKTVSKIDVFLSQLLACEKSQICISETWWFGKSRNIIYYSGNVKGLQKIEWKVQNKLNNGTNRSEECIP
jgi:hypothetical protein